MKASYAMLNEHNKKELEKLTKTSSNLSEANLVSLSKLAIATSHDRVTESKEFSEFYSKNCWYKKL